MNDEFVRNIIAFKGDEGKSWLSSIPTIVNKYEKLWSLKVHAPYHLSYNYVAPATRMDGAHAVLKIAVPDGAEFWAELGALRIFDGHGACALLESDAENGVMLIERVVPGIQLSALEDDDKATRILATIMKKLWHTAPKNHHFPTLKDRCKGFERFRTAMNGTTGPFPEAIFTEGEKLFTYLSTSSSENYVLHSDLHHDNVLSATRDTYLAIDPHGVVGERAHETAAMLRNPQRKLRAHTSLRPLLARRISILSEELQIDSERIRRWGVAMTVLTAIWKFEDHGKDWDYTIHIAETISSL